LGEYFDWPLCSIGEHSGSQSFYSWARRLGAVTDIYQGLIGHDAPVMLRVRHSHSGYGGEYDALEGLRKEDVTSKISDPPFANFDQRSPAF